MPKTVTSFDTNRHHIHIEFFVTDGAGIRRSFDGVIDTGAPRTEFSDTFLRYAGLLSETDKDISIKSGLQTQKYGKIVLPLMEICGHSIENFEVLDFFRRFRITIDYRKGKIITESFN